MDQLAYNGSAKDDIGRLLIPAITMPRKKTPDEWIQMFTLPNITIEEPVEIDGVAMVPVYDQRAQTLAQRHKRFSMYLNRFTSEFGQQISPSLILVRADKFEQYRSAEALAGLRDAIAISTIPYSWSQVLRFENNHNIKYANWFSFYPWVVDNKYEGLVMQSMAQMGWHEVKAMKGQTTPGISHMALAANMIDKALLPALLERWVSRFAAATPSKSDRSLLRSLNMALSAAMLPGNVEVTIFDLGRSIALWVSAFEILTKEGTCDAVYKLLEATKWNLSDNTDPVYEPHKYKPGQPKRPLPVWLYGAMNHARNDFIHGNAIDRNRLIVAPGKRPLHLYTALLYRMALTSFLDLKHSPVVKKKGQTEYDAHWRHMHEFGWFQSNIEAAIATVMFTQEEYRQMRQGKIDAARARSRHKPVT
jgi:hypothetical protein